MVKLKRPDTSFNRVPFVYLIIPLVLGIVFNNWFPNIFTTLELYCSLVGLFITSCCLLILNSKNKLTKSLNSIFLLACIFISGIIFNIQSNPKEQSNWYAHQRSQTTAYIGKVTAPTESKTKTIRVALTIIKKRVDTGWQTTTGKLLLYIYKQDSLPKINPGDKFIIPNKLVLISNRGNPFEFDYASYLNRRGLYYQAFLSFDDLYLIKTSSNQSHFINQLRNQLLFALQNNITDTTTLALTEATLLNDRSLLENEIWRAYSVTGIAHIIAISGMHVSLFFSILLVFLWWLKPPKLRWLKYLLALPLIWLYIALTNYPPSAVRAAIMFSLVFLGLFLRKAINPINFLAATGFVILCLQPSWLFETGMQLSFIAVASIFLFYKPIHKFWTPKNKVIAALWSLIALSLSVQIFIFPIVMYYFHQFPLWFLLANIPAAVFSLLLMIMALLLLVLSCIGIPCIWLGDVMAMMTHGFHKIIFFLAQHTPSDILQLYLSTTGFWLLMFSIISLCIFLFFKKNIFAYFGISLLCILVSSYIYNDLQTYHRQRVVVYNSSQNSMIDFFNGKTCIPIRQVDAGLQSKMTQYVLLPSRLGFRSNKKILTQSNVSILLVNEKKILILEDTLPKHAFPFPVDYLILTNRCPLQPQRWVTQLQAKKIILDGSFPRWKSLKWEKILSSFNIPVHNVQTDGAWVLPSK